MHVLNFQKVDTKTLKYGGVEPEIIIYEGVEHIFDAAVETNSELLHHMVENEPKHKSLIRVSTNPNIKEETLVAIASKPLYIIGHTILQKIVKNKNCTAEVLWKVLEHKMDETIPIYIGEHPKATAEILQKLAEVSPEYCFDAVVENPTTSVGTLKYLMAHPAPEHICKIFTHPNCTPEMVEEVFSNKDDWFNKCEQVEAGNIIKNWTQYTGWHQEWIFSFYNIKSDMIEAICSMKTENDYHNSEVD